MKRFAILALAAVLASCGGSDEISMRIEKSPARLLTPLTLASTAEVSPFLPGLKVVKTRPSDRELVFTMPGDGQAEPATIRFRFDPLDGGSASDAHAYVDVPNIVANIDGKRQILSEARVTTAVRKILTDMAAGKSDHATADMSKILIALAISTDTKLRDKALAMAKGKVSEFDLADEDAPSPDDLAPVEENDPTEYDAPDDQGYSEEA